MENRPGRNHPAHVSGGMSEHGLLHVRLEGRQDSLQTSKGDLLLHLK